MHHPTDRIAHTTAFVTPVSVTTCLSHLMMHLRHFWSTVILEPKGVGFFFGGGLIFILPSTM